MRFFKTIGEVEKGAERLKDITTSWRLVKYIAFCMPFIARQFYELNKKTKKRRKHKLTEWQKAVKKGMRQGKSIKQISKEYAA